MQQIRIILNSGKEITFEAEDDFTMQECTKGATYHATDGNAYNINSNSVAAIITAPLIQCQACKKWMRPEYRTVRRYKGNEHTAEVSIYCAECGVPIDVNA